MTPFNIDFAFRWKVSPWCLQWSHLEVTDNDQNNSYLEAVREGVYTLALCTLHLFLASITQCDRISMNNAALLCPGLEYDARLHVHTDMKEEGQRFFWMIKAKTSKKMLKQQCVNAPVTQMSLIFELVHFPSYVAIYDFAFLM